MLPDSSFYFISFLRFFISIIAELGRVAGTRDSFGSACFYIVIRDS